MKTKLTKPAQRMQSVSSNLIKLRRKLVCECTICEALSAYETHKANRKSEKMSAERANTDGFTNDKNTIDKIMKGK